MILGAPIRKKFMFDDSGIPLPGHVIIGYDDGSEKLVTSDRFWVRFWGDEEDNDRMQKRF